MILSENQLKIPGKMYKVRVKCVSTRRLTTIEWLILSCTQKFNKSNSMSGKTLKYAFEEVLQFQNSELLIKPCLRNLSGLKVIRISGDGNFDYNKLKFEDIEVTELGQYMVKEGLLPGEAREMPLDIYYNPLTGKMNNYFNGNSDSKDAVEFGTESDYNTNFPEERVINELQAGSVGGGRFTASKFRIEEIESLTSTDWESNINMTVDVNEEGVITTNPEIIEENVKSKISSLLLTKEINQQIVSKLPVIDTDEVQNIVGSGKNIKQSILDICKNGKLLFMDAAVYGLYKRNTASFKDTTVILFNDEDGFSIENEKGLIIHIPEAFPIKGCVVINEKGKHICLGKTEYLYEEKAVTVPLVYENKVLSKKNKIAVEWLQDVVRKNSAENIQYIALYTLPILAGNQKNCKEALLQHWETAELPEIIAELEKIHLGCIWMKTEMFQLDIFTEALIKKIDFEDYESALKSIKAIMDTNCIRKNSESHRKMVEILIEYVRVPTSYRDLFILLQSLGITTHEDALRFDDLISGLYTKTVMVDILTAIADGIYTKIPELFEYDVFFNEYQECISAIELHVSGLHLFEQSSENELKSSVLSCPDIAALQSYVSELRSKNEYLLKKQKINIDEVLKKTMPLKATAFVENIRLIEKYAEQAINEMYEQTTTIVSDAQSKKNNGKKIYIVDTCALMHHPDLFLYFEDEEYVRIPTKVIDELGKIKDKRNKKYGAELSETARILAREIERTYLKVYNKNNKVRLMIENAAPELLPRELDPDVPDNQILSVALKYKNWEVFIISDDGVFRLAAMAQRIVAMNSEDFINQHKEHYKSLEERIKECNSETNTEITNKDIASDTESEEASELLADKIAKAVGNIILEPSMQSEEEDGSQELAIDDLPIRELKKYIPDFNEPVFSYLQSNQVKTVGAFRHLTESKVRNMPAKGKQMVYKNTVIRAVKQLDSIIAKIKLK